MGSDGRARNGTGDTRTGEKIMLRKRLVGLIAVGLMLAAALVTGLAAGPADAAAAHSTTIHTARAMNLPGDPSGSCGIWTDGTSFGIRCTGFSGWSYRSRAACKDNKTALGPFQPGTSNKWSYAYCSTDNSTISYVNTDFYQFDPKAKPLGDPSGSCQVWTDGTTFGIRCTGFSGWSYYSDAVCVSGNNAAGTRENGTSNAWSYAYCSTYGSTVNYAQPYFSPFTV